jgi:molybdopterin-synthase adenylyltransferase
MTESAGGSGVANKTEFSDLELSRYSRHILLPHVDVAGQLAFANAEVLIIGLGGLGSPVAQYLAASGIGRLVLVDFDQVELSNLQRQVIHNERSIGMDKVTSAAQTINLMNSDCVVQAINRSLSESELAEAVGRADVVVDCTDNFSTRVAINQQCFVHKTPLVSGAAIRAEGQVIVFDFRNSLSPCYQCLYQLNGDQSLTCSQSGVLAPVVGVVGALQAVEVLKLVGGFGQSLVGRLQLYDALSGRWRELKLTRDPSCPVCGGGRGVRD